MSRGLIIAGAIFIILGLIWPWLSRIPLGRLPGDLSLEKENFTLYFPLTTSLLVSILLSLFFWLLRR